MSREAPPEMEGKAGGRGDRFVVPATHRTAVLEGLDQADRREFATDKEMAALWKKCGL